MAAVATTAAALAGGASPAGAACGASASVQPFVDHVDAAHLERSPLQQARDLADLDQYTLTHTVLVESMLAPIVPTVADSLAPFEQHVDAAHLERSPMQQAADIMNTDDYVLAHTVLVESMLAPLLGSGCAGSGQPAPSMPAHGQMPAPAPAAPAAPVAAAPAAVEIHDYSFVPRMVSVPVGTAITWTNHDADTHTVVGSGMKSRSLAMGDSYSHTFASPGTFSYVCSIHPNMKASVTVQ
jgi:plastocyanin